MRRVAKELGYAEETRGTKEQANYKKNTTSGLQLNLVPLVFKHFGLWGTGSSDYLNQPSKRSRDLLNYKNEADFKNKSRRHSSVLLQRCKTRVILKKVQDSYFK